MADKPAQAFLSYTHADDEHLNGGITWLREELQRAMLVLTGEPFSIFQDVSGIAIGEPWQRTLEDTLRSVNVLIPIMTPAYFASEACRAEATSFLDAEKQTGRSGTILPIYLITSEVLELPEARENDDLAQQLSQRRYADWRAIKLDDKDSPQLRELVEELAKRIYETRWISPPPIPEQRSYYRFLVNEKGQIDRAPDDAPDVDDNDPEMLDQQAGLLDACRRFLDPSRDSSAGRNFYGRLIDVVGAYEAAISEPLSEINFSEVWRLGSRLQNAWNAAERQIKRLDDLGEEAPELENEQKAAFDDLMNEHGPFVLKTPAGLEQQALADRFNDTQVEQQAKRAAGQSLNEAVQAEDTLFADAAKRVIAEISEEQGQGRHPERHAVIAETTYQNLLALTGKVAKFAGGGAALGVIGNAAYDALPLAKDLLLLSGPAIEAAKAFWLSNQSVLVTLAAASGEGLAWLPPFTDWIRAQAQTGEAVDDGLQATQTASIVTNDFWTPGRVFRDIDEPWCPEMVVIPAGEFMMGSPEDEEGRQNNEGPQHLVTIKRPFALGRYPVTFEEFDHFCEETGTDKPDDARWGRGRRPVINVSWHDVGRYCDWLTRKSGFTYVLPSESWWEYACRAGSKDAYAFGETIDERQANFNRNAGKTSEVGAYPANAFKLFDMHGNVWEWCDDRWHPDYEGSPSDGSSWYSGNDDMRVLRGGSWGDGAQNLRSARRDADAPDYRDLDIGFRCARVQE